MERALTKSIEDPAPEVLEEDRRFTTAEHRLEEGGEHLPSEITYDEQRYPARPTRLRPVARRRLRDRVREAVQGDAAARRNGEYVKWLVEESMLWDAKQLAIQLSGQGSMFQNPFAHPNPRAALERASVWFTAYPLSFITRRASRSSPASPTRRCGRRSRDRDRRVHTGPVKQAGGLDGWRRRRRSTGTSTASACRSTRPSGPRSSSARCARRRPSTTARSSTTSSRATPARARTSAWPRWATPTTRASTTWSGSPRRTGTCCPTSPRASDAVNLDAEAEAALARAGYIIGRLQRVIFYEPGVKETNWSATRGRHGRRRGRAALGLPALLQVRPALDQLARPVVRRHAPGHRRRAARARPTSAPARCAWTPTASSASRRAPRTCPPGRRAIRSRRRPTSSSRAWSARWAASPSRS